MTSAPIAAELGRLAAPAHRAPFEDVRLALLDAIVAAKNDSATASSIWPEAFGAAARSLRLRVIADADAGLRAAAKHSRYPSRRLKTLLPDAESADTLLHRLLAEGMPLERLEGLADEPATRRARAAALEVAWEGAVRLASAEGARWRAVAAGIAAWKRPILPAAVAGGALVVAASIVSAWLGGELASPGWFHHVNNLWWALPWP
ncbi:MAG TPA: hypothetical protein VGL65_06070 [Gemmatimonadales bacterium]